MPYSYEFPNYSPPPKIGADNLLQLYERVSGEYNSLINKIDQLQYAMQGYYQYTNKAVEGLDKKTQASINLMRIQIDNSYQSLQQQINNLTRYVQDEIAAINVNMEDAIKAGFIAVEQDFAQWESTVDNRVTAINLALSDIYNRLQTLEMERQRIFKLDAPVVSPFTLTTMELQDCINQMAMWLSTDALSAGELARASWVHAGDVAKWSVRELITISRRKANKRGYNKYMRSPFSGEWERIKYVLNAAINFILPGSMTMSQIDAQGFTCQQVADAGLTAYDMTVNNKKLMEVIDNGNTE